ncbi:hypothetical protein HII31_10904 [Pseudocercospora fuligena]|uniref:Uncharacterized protein n=1 Tax=Pseudocercospora fuligena TaxID=685502 RepID=A0A8H6VD09_9PEZI|nr:hypothetical protein HII31_10904 [Pseudocercospora fuligena]
MFSTWANVCRAAGKPKGKDQLVAFAGELMTPTQAAWLKAHPELLKQFEGRLITETHFQHLLNQKRQAEQLEAARLEEELARQNKAEALEAARLARQLKEKEQAEELEAARLARELAHRQHLEAEKVKRAKHARLRWKFTVAKVICRIHTIKKFRFFDLPFAIRQKILRRVFPKTTAAVFLPGKYGRPRSYIPIHDLFWTCRQLRAEALLVFIEQTNFAIHSFPGNEQLVNWLKAISFKPVKGEVGKDIFTGLDALRSLEFPYFSRFPHARFDDTTPNSDVQLMSQAPQLQEVRLNWVWSELTYRPNPYDEIPKDLSTLRRQFRLDGILGLRRLKKVVLRGPVFVEETIGLKALAKWMEKGFKARGQVVEVELIKTF